MVVLLAPLAADIPLTALAAILFVVAWNMSEAHRVVHLIRSAPGADVAVLVITLLLTVFSDLVVAVNVGVVLAALMFMRRMAGAGGTVAPPAGTVVFSIDGPFFFGVAERLEHALKNIHGQAGTLVLRLSRVPFIDATAIGALSALADECARAGTRLVLCEVKPNVLAKLDRAGLVKKLGEGGVLSSPEECFASIEPQEKARSA